MAVLVGLTMDRWRSDASIPSRLREDEVSLVEVSIPTAVTPTPACSGRIAAAAFNCRQGPCYDTMVWETATRYARQAGLKVDQLDERSICAHASSVTAITASFEGGANLEEIQQIVGHKDRRDTLRYRRASPKDTVNAVMRINC